MKQQVRWLLGLALVVLTTLTRAEPFSPSPATMAQLEAIREGGYVLFIRHGPTDSGQPDQVPIDLDDCGTQRPLSQAGRDIMRDVARQFHQANIPFSDVYSSPLCRAYQTAAIIFGDEGYRVDQNLMYVAALTSSEKQPIIARTHELLSTPVAPGSNRVLVAHGPNMVEVMEYFPVEGTLVIIRPRPDGSGFDYVASIEPNHWNSLLQVAE
ncbi:histidine phosphatase family protein [Marinobacterium sp. MBR-109]|jgi:phosphohistidine phosphatase SixA|uniref:histidine phosphatase family protein n=1 Tax=Marinobacterium sp. MBR-109 TaxID=3156462 RepID=UPI0033936B29